MPYSGSLRFPTFGRSVRGRRRAAPLGAGHQVHIGMRGFSEEHDGREAVARRPKSPLGPENVPAQPLSGHENLERAARGSLHVELAARPIARRLHRAIKVLESLYDDRLAKSN